MASKVTPCFRVEPETQVAFNYVPRKYLNSNIYITNTSEQPIAYKVKTNVPTCYLVKPHVGTLPPHHSIDINITMQPTDYNPQNASINDKFLINIVPLPVDTDLASLADQTRFQQIWDSVPKSQVQSHKLKVVLKFEAVPREKAEKPLEELSRQTSSESKKSETNLTNTIGSKLGESLKVSQESSREDLKNSSMMMSFGNSLSVTTPNRSTNQAPGSWTDQSLATSQTVTLSKVGNEEKEKAVENKEVKSEEKTKEVREVLKPLEEKVEQLGKRIDELMNEKKMLSQRHQELTGKAEEQQRILFGLSEENTRLKSELGNLKSSTFLEKSQRKTGQVEPGSYQLWQVLVVSLVAMVIGAYFSSH